MHLDIKAVNNIIKDLNLNNIFIKWVAQCEVQMVMKNLKILTTRK